MGRLRRFDQHRFVGTRDTMTVYDGDDEEQFSELETRVAEDDLLDRNLLQAFAPDTLPEARNRGFSPRR
jgi:hypothetical protein